MTEARQRHTAKLGRVPIIASAALALALVLSACSSSGGGSEDSSNNSGGAGATGSKAKLTIGIVSSDPSYGAPFIGQDKGYFADQNLEINVTNIGVNGIPALVSGQIDVLMSGSASAFVLAGQGKAPAILYANSAGSIASFVIAKNSINNIKDCNSMATSSPGTAAYGWAAFLKKEFNAKFRIETTPNADLQAAGVSAGRYDCATGTYGTFAPLINNGKIHLILDPSKPETLPATYPKSVIAGVVLVNKSSVESKKAALTAFVRGMVQANTYIKTLQPTEIQSMLSKHEQFVTSMKSPTAVDGITRTLTFLAPCNGFVPESAWTEETDWIAGSGLKISGAVTDEKYSYNTLVDMSLYKANAENTSSC